MPVNNSIPDINQIQAKPASKAKDSSKKRIQEEEAEQKKKQQEEQARAEQKQENSMRRLRRMVKLLKKLKTAVKTGAVAFALYKAAQFIAGIWETIKNGVATFVTWIQNGLTAIANALGTSVISVSIAAGAILLTPLTLAAYAYESFNGNRVNEIAKLDPIPEACSVEVERTAQANGVDGSDSVSDLESKRMENARKVYALFKSKNYSDNHIAAILACWQAESGLDSTTLEGIYDEPFAISDRKQEAMKDLNAYAQNYLFPKYNSEGVGHVAANYKAGDGKYYPGFGLAQWTGPAAKTFLDTAKSAGHDWHDFDFQLAYSISSKYRPEFFQREDWNKTNITLEEATAVFLRSYEGAYTDSYYAKRLGFAKKWIETIQEFSEDHIFASKVVSLADEIGGTAIMEDMYTAYDLCKTASDYSTVSNASIAESAATLAWDQMNNAANYGTDLYRTLVGKVVPDMYSPNVLRGRNCTTGAITAIRWAGADDQFPGAGNPIDLKRYMDDSDKWKLIGTSKEIHSQADVEALLQPGDVCVIPAPESFKHICIYTGREVIQKFTSGSPDPQSDSVHAAASSVPKSMFAYPGNFYSHIQYQTQSGGTYYFYRNVKPETNSAYAKIRP